MQLSFKKAHGRSGRAEHRAATLAELREGEQGIIEHLDLPALGWVIASSPDAVG